MNLLLVISFLAGVITPLVFILIYIAWLGRDIEKAKGKNRTPQAHEMIGSIKYRFKEIESITMKQLELMDMLQAPNKGAAHARGKKTLVDSISSLEDNKMDIFRSILKDGFDPKVTIYDENGQKVDMKMSEALKKSDDLKREKEEKDNRFKPKHKTPPPPTKLRPKSKKTDLKSSRDNVYNLNKFRRDNDPGPKKTH